MNANFSPCLDAVLKHEGGYVNDPLDRGGETNKGITQAVYDDWRASHKLPSQTVKLLDPIEVEAIYKRWYWDAVHADQLPSGVDYCAFDFAVNSGANRAARYLQRAAGVVEDGVIGPATLAAVSAKSPLALINAISSARQAFLAQLPTFKRFGKGWTERVFEVEAKARGMAS